VPFEPADALTFVIARSARCWHEKELEMSRGKWFDLARVDILVTDDALPVPLRAVVKESVCELVLAVPPRTRPRKSTA
jgi:hypothetical protein